MIMFCVYVLCTAVGGIIGNEYFDHNVLIGSVIGFFVAFIIHCVKIGITGESFGDVFESIGDSFGGGDFGGGGDFSGGD